MHPYYAQQQQQGYHPQQQPPYAAAPAPYHQQASAYPPYQPQQQHYQQYAAAAAVPSPAFPSLPPAPAYYQQQTNSNYVTSTPAVVAPIAAAAPKPSAYISSTPATASVAVSSDSADAPLEMKLENAHYNLNEVLGANIVGHIYYRNLGRFTTLGEIIDEIYTEVKHVEPSIAGKERLPSTAFFLLYKLFTMNLSKKDLNVLIRHKDSPYIRAIGFLYLRCVLDPKKLWDWFEPYLDDTTEFVPGQSDKQPKTMGAYLRDLLEKNDYYTMKMRRIPVPVQREFQLKLLAKDARRKRAEKNEPYRSKITKGMKLQAEYLPDMKFYEAIVDRVEEGEYGRFVVVYVEYGNSEEVDIGALKLPPEIMNERGGRDRDVEPQRTSSSSSASASGGRNDRGRRSSRSRSRSRERKGGRRDYEDYDRKRRSRSRDRSRSQQATDVFSDLPHTHRTGALQYAREPRRSRDRDRSRERARSPSPEVSLDAVIRADREAAAAQSRGEYSRRPTSYKNGLSLQAISGTNRKRSRTPPPVRASTSSSSLSAIAEEAPKKVGLSEEEKAKRAALLAKYGNVSSQKDKMDAARGRTNVEDDDIVRLGR